MVVTQQKLEDGLLTEHVKSAPLEPTLKLTLLMTAALNVQKDTPLTWKEVLQFSNVDQVRLRFT